MFVTKLGRLTFGDTLGATRDALTAKGFGVVTEIDLQAILKARVGGDVLPQVILGACRPPLAHAALQTQPSFAVKMQRHVRGAGRSRAGWP